MQNNLDYYEALDVDKTSTLEEIRRAYISLALKWHPDKNLIGKKRAEKAFVEINEAYAVLSDNGLREIYDLKGIGEVKSSCTKYNLNNFSLDDAYALFNSLYRNRNPISACLEDENWYENSEIFTGGLTKNKYNQIFRGRNDIETDVIETSMSKYSTSPRSIEKTIKTLVVEKGGRRVKKTITTVIRADGTQEIVEEEKEEPILKNNLI